VALSKIPSAFSAAFKTALGGRLSEILIARGFRVGSLDELITGLGYSALAPRTGVVGQFAKGIVSWRKALSQRVLSRGPITHSDNGDVALTAKVLDVTDNRVSWPGSEALWCLVSPELATTTNEGWRVNKMGQNSVMTAKSLQDFAVGSSIANQTWTFSIWVKHDPTTSAINSSRITMCVWNGTTESELKQLTFAPTTGWVRYSVTGTWSGAPAANTIRCYYEPSPSIATTSMPYHVGDAQLEQAAAASAFEPTQETVRGAVNKLLNSMFPGGVAWTNTASQLLLNAAAGDAVPVTATPPGPGLLLPSITEVGVALADGDLEVRQASDAVTDQGDTYINTSPSPYTTEPVVYQVATGLTPNNKTYTISVWARAKNGAAPMADFYFGLRSRNSGAIVQDAISTSYVLTPWWQRYWFSFAFTASSTANEVMALIRNAQSAASENDEMEIWGARLEEFSGTTLQPPLPGGLAGNLFSNPYAFDNAAWTKQVVTITPNTAAAPWYRVQLNHPDRLLSAGTWANRDVSSTIYADSATGSSDNLVGWVLSVGSAGGTDILAGTGDFKTWAAGLPTGWTFTEAVGDFSQATTLPGYDNRNEDTADVSGVKYVQAAARTAEEDYISTTVTFSPGSGFGRWHLLLFRCMGIGIAPRVQLQSGSNYLANDRVSSTTTNTWITLQQSSTAEPTWSWIAMPFFKPFSWTTATLRISPGGAGAILPATGYIDSVRIFDKSGELYPCSDRPETISRYSKTTLQGLLVLARGFVEEVTGGTESTLDLKIGGYLHKLDAKVPQRVTSAECPWKYGGASCGAGSLVLVNGAQSSVTSVVVDSNTAFDNARDTGRVVLFGASAANARTISSIPDSTHINVTAAITVADNDTVRFADCRHTEADCIARKQTHRYGGFPGIAGIISQGDRLTAKRLLGSPTALNPRYGGGETFRVGRPGTPWAVFEVVHHPWSAESDSLDNVSLPVIYGRKTVKCPFIEKRVVVADPTGGDKEYIVAIYAIGEGEIDAVRYLRTQDSFVVHSGDAAGGGQWWFWRPGAIGLDAETGQSSWTGSKATQQLAQNRDFRSAFGIAYSETAYLILQILSNISASSNAAEDLGELPEVFADVRGKKVQAYNADGTVNGAKAWSQNPVWCLADLLLDTRYGGGLPTDIIDWASWKVAADACDVVISSVEAVTTATAAVTASTEIPVKSVVGFAPEMTITVTSVSPDPVVDLVDPVEQKIYVKTAITASNGATVQGRPKTYALNMTLDDPRKLSEAVGAILSVFRGRLAWDGHKLALQIETDVSTTASASFATGSTTMRNYLPESFKTDMKQGWRTNPNVAEIVYSRGSSFYGEPALHKIVDHQNGGADNPRPVRIDMMGCDTADQAARAAMSKLSKVTPSVAGSEAQYGEGFSFRTGLAGLLEKVGDVLASTKTATGLAITNTSRRGRLTSKIIAPDLTTELRCSPERVNMAFDSYSPAVNMWTGERNRRAEPGQPITPGSISISVVRQSNRGITLSITRTGTTTTPNMTSPGRGARYGGSFELHVSATSGFTPEIGVRGAGSTYQASYRGSARNVTWSVPDSLVGTAIYLKVVWIAPRGGAVPYLVSNQLGPVTVFRVDRDETDPSQPQANNPFNMVYEGDFVNDLGTTGDGTGFGWQDNLLTTVAQVDPNANSLQDPISTPWDTRVAFTSPTNAYDADINTIATGTANGPPGFELAVIRFGFAAATRTGRIRIRARKSTTQAQYMNVYYSTNGGTNWTLMTTITSSTLSYYTGPTLNSQAMASLLVQCEVRIDVASASVSGEIADFYFEEDTSITTLAGVASNFATLRGNGTLYAQVFRRFPGRAPVDFGVYFTANTVNTCRVRIRRSSGASAATHPVQVVLFDEQTQTTTVILSVAATDITAAWQDFAVLFPVTTPIQGKLWIYVRTQSTQSVDVDKVGIWRGDLINAWAPSSEEQAAGYFGDFTPGDALAHPRGTWVAGTYRTSPVS